MISSCFAPWQRCRGNSGPALGLMRNYTTHLNVRSIVEKEQRPVPDGITLRSDQKKIRIAYDAAKTSTHYKYRLGAALFRGNRLVATGTNKIKTHPKSPNPYRMVHAEVDAMLRVDQDLIVGCSMFVVRLLKNLNFAPSKPCECCWQMAVGLGVRRIVFYDEFSDRFESLYV
jgi:deoxycytidylate deaminase